MLFSYPKNIVLLLSRLVIAYGFAVPALVKVNDLEGTVKWFASISIPFPMLAAYLVSGIEMLGIIFLILGLLTRLTSILLSFVMLGAMFFVHIQHGFSVANNGIEIPLYYFIFLMIFATFGPGKYSFDHLLFEGEKHE
ncbi:MAG: DoxX family protein [Epsilonproteobacteria bacterium (ex Lamellibrachia satsuma)]|nr:MAG: DoxX family protein [Epsilonproteobacteria bacterium (ex Lamellibrachia satsuma)]